MRETKAFGLKLLYMVLALTMLMSVQVFAAGGWATENGNIYYEASEGDAESRITGLKKIGKYKYYFDEEGVLQTGLQQVGRATYFFKRNGAPGKRGRMIKNKYVSYRGNKYFFKANGKMVKNKWVGDRLFGSDGVMLKSAVTPDYYYVDASGERVEKLSKKGLYLLDEKYYYWNGKKKGFLKSATKTIDEVVWTFDADGVGTSSASSAKSDGLKNILIVSGHGQGDSGAASSLGAEYLKTREFGKLIYEQLKASGKVNVTFYKNGSASYDLYQQNKATLGSSGANLTITGSGANKARVISAIKRNANIPVLTDYDYVLEVHFNATAVSSKDISGNGSYKGFGFYLNSYKSDTKVERKINAKIAALGFTIWGGGLQRSSTLFNARICQELGVNYALVETAFIDDKDDMTFYNNNKNKMAKAVADSIIDIYG